MNLPNIYFKIGQPNTGKSYGFGEYELKKKYFKKTNIVYRKIPVSGGVGNEYKGLQNTDLAIGYDAVNRNIKFGEFLKMLMCSIINPDNIYIVFLDDFHNQDISALLSEYTPLFKPQQKIDLKDSETIKNASKLNLLTQDIFENSDEFIKEWNNLMLQLKEEYEQKDKRISIESITNRISGNDLFLVYPANFYLLGAANFNEKSLNIFTDWSDRAHIEYVNPIEIMKDINNIIVDKNTKDFVECVKQINYNLKDILEEEMIFDYEKYCFGIWKIVDENNKIISESKKQKELIKYLFFMIKNSLIYNNKNSQINKIGWKLIKKMHENNFFKTLFEEEIENINFELDFDNEQNYIEICKILYKFNLFEE